MWAKVKYWWSMPFPFYLNSDRENLIMVTGIGLFTLLFLLIFEPFGLAFAIQEESAPFVFSGIAFAVLLVHVVVIPRLLPRYFDDSDWCLGGFAAYNVWILTVVSFFIALYSHYFLDISDHDSFGGHLVEDLFRVMTIGLMPVVGMLFIIRNQMLLKTLREVKLANHTLGQRKPSLLKQGDHAGSNGVQVWSIQADTHEQLSIPDGSLLYAEADDNYSRIHWMENDQVQERLLRLTLKSLEEQLPMGRIARVHRSFLANLEQVDELRGNASGYRLFFALANAEIPVARNRSRDILVQIEGDQAPA